MYENYSVLFVDDEVNILSSLKRGLIDEEYSCHFASSGKEALKIMECEKIAVIVTDMRMPEMDGLHLLRIVKDRWPRTVGIVLSGYTQMQQILTTINQVDIFKYITKPWKLEEEFKFVLYKALDYYILQEENDEYKIALQKKNEAYQNIFKSIQTIMDNSKNSCHILGVFGKSIHKYNRCVKNGLSDEFNEFEEIIFDNFTTAVTGEKKEYNGEKFEKDFLKYIQSNKEVSKKESKLDKNLKINLNPSIVESTLNACMTVFCQELKGNDLLVTFDSIPDRCVTISLFSRLTFEDDMRENLTLSDKKVDFLNSIFQETLKLCMMDFCVINKNERLAIVISIALLIPDK